MAMSTSDKVITGRQSENTTLFLCMQCTAFRLKEISFERKQVALTYVIDVIFGKYHRLPSAL